MKRLIIVLIMGTVLTACNQDPTLSESYAIIVVINDTEYYRTEQSLSDYEIDRPIGIITKKVESSKFPADSQSNFFEEGSIIYSVKTSADFIIVENTAGELNLLQTSIGTK